jgi:hypothetical protein
MLGSFQQCELRIELDASAAAIADLLQCPNQWHRWLPPLPDDTPRDRLPERLTAGTHYRRAIGPLAIAHHVQRAETNSLSLLLSGGIDGHHDWRWGDGWVQSRLEGISPLPLRLAHSLSLQALRQALQHPPKP